MWYKSDEDGYESNKTGSSSGGCPGWVHGQESVWHNNPPGPGNNIYGGRRLSTVSDSDTGIGTYCSDSVEDDSSSSTAPLSLQPMFQHHLGQDDDVIPIAHTIPSPPSSPYTSFRMPASNTRYQLFMPAISPVGAPSTKDSQPVRRWSSLTKLSSGADMNSTRTSGHQYNPDSLDTLDRGLLYGYRKEPLSSNVDLYLPLSSSLLCHSLLQRSPGSGPFYQYKQSSAALETDLSLSSALSSPVKHNSLDMNYSALPETKLARGDGQVYSLSLPKQMDSLCHQTDRSSLIQTALRTQMWLTEQMEYRPKVEHGGKLGQINTCTARKCCDQGELSPRQRGHQQEAGFTKVYPEFYRKEGRKDRMLCLKLKAFVLPIFSRKLLMNMEYNTGWYDNPGNKASVDQMVVGTSLPVKTLMKVKEELLRQRELEIDRQKQQILQLYVRIRENELRAQQVLQSQKGWFDNSHIPNAKESVMKIQRKQQSAEVLGRKLEVAELEVLRLNEFFKQVTQKYTEDVRKLDEKIKTRDCYISSLKKKCQRESKQNQEKQQRIETLEKYLSDLPTMDEVQVQSRQQEKIRKKAGDLEKIMCRLQKSIDAGCALMKEKNIKIEMQAKREKELISSVHSLQKKVQQCLDDGVRLPMVDLKQLEVENAQLLEQQDHSSKLIDHQKEQIERLTLQLTATNTRLQMNCQRLKKQWQVDEGLLVHPLSHVEIPEVGQLLKEMSLCLLDLQALCSILTQRAQGKEPNLSLLLDIKSLSVSGQESDCRDMVEEELRFKLQEVSKLRKDIDKLRKSISDRSAQYMDDSCVSQ